MPLLRQDTTGDDNSSDSSYSRRFSLAAGTTFIVECTIKNLTLCPSSKYLWVLKWPKFRGWQFIIHMSSSCFNFIQKIGQCERNKSPKYIIMILKKRLYIYSIWNFLTLFVDEMIKLMSYPSFSVAFYRSKTKNLLFLNSVTITYCTSCEVRIFTGCEVQEFFRNLVV